MESLEPYSEYLEELRCKAEKLTSTAISLVTLFAEEANRLNREDEALRLRRLFYSVPEQLKQAKRSEHIAENAARDINLISSLGGLALSLLAPKNELLSSISRLSNNPDTSKRPFGNVMVCIGSEGLPEDITVVSISELARESNRTESQVINELHKGGCLLFDEKSFSLLIDKLIEGVRSGQLYLPISKEKLAEIAASYKLNPEAPGRQ